MFQHAITLILSVLATAALLTGLRPTSKPGPLSGTERDRVRGLQPNRILASLGFATAWGTSLALLAGDFTSAAPQFVHQLPLLPSLGVQYRVGVDGLSLWLVLLATTFVPLGAWLTCRAADGKHERGLLASFLVLELALVGAFSSLDLVLFYIFFELTLIPTLLLIGIWGGPDRKAASLRFVLYTLTGSLAFLAAILGLGHHVQLIKGAPSFDIADLSHLVLEESTQLWLAAGFILAFAVKTPIFPFHGWMPKAYGEAPTGVTLVLSAVMAKLGVYGFLRFFVPVLTRASHLLGPTLCVLALVGALYFAFCAWAQNDLKQVLAYSSASHLGLSVLGVFAIDQASILGSTLHMLSHGITSAALFTLAAWVERRRGTLSMEGISGLAKTVPLLSASFVFFSLASIALPGTSAFIGEFLIFAGTLFSEALPTTLAFTAVAALSAIFGAVYMLRVLLRMVWGPETESTPPLTDLTRTEAAVALAFSAAILYVGLIPTAFSSRITATSAPFVEAYRTKLVASFKSDQPRAVP